MKRFLALAALLFFSTFAFSQDFDFQLDPIENETITPTAYDLQAGNYAGKLLKIDLFEAQIEGQLKEDIYIFIIDTGIDFDHPFLRKIIMKKYARSFVPPIIEALAALLYAHHTCLFKSTTKQAGMSVYGSSCKLKPSNLCTLRLSGFTLPIRCIKIKKASDKLRLFHL